MKQIKQAVQLIILFILAVSCSNILGPSDNNQSNIYGVSQGHAAGINYLGDVSKVFSAPSNGRYGTGQIINNFYGSGKTVRFEGNLVEYNLIKKEILDYVESIEKNNALMHQYYENMSYDPVKKYVEVSSYTDIKTGKVLCFELRVFFGNFLETFEDSFWYAKSVTFNPSFTRDIDNNIPVNFGIPLGNAEDDDAAIIALRAKVQHGNKQVNISWDKIDIVKNVKIEWRNNNEEKSELIEAGTTNVTITGLENYRNYTFTVVFLDKEGKEIKKTWISATPRTGDDQKDFAQEPADFVNDKAHLLLKPEFKIDKFMHYPKEKFSFSKSNNDFNFEVPKYFSGEDELGYTDWDKERLKKDKYQLIWRRMAHVLKYGDHYPSQSAYANNGGGNVRWLLYLADFLNLYKQKFPGMVDLKNAPEWFIQLMNNRKGSNDSYINDIYKN